MFRTKPEDRDPEIVQRQTADAGRLWAMLDAHLANRDYVIGDSFTMGDIPLGTYAWRWLSVDAARPELANLKAWHQRLCNRPAYRDHVMLPLIQY